MLGKVLLIFALITMSFANVLVAEEPKAEGGPSAIESSASDGAIVEDTEADAFLVRNKVCPYCGMQIPAEKLGQVTVVYQNKRYNVCSVEDRDGFLTDPDKYSKIADDEMAGAANIYQPAPVE